MLRILLRNVTLLLIPHRIQMFYNRKIRIQEPIHTILRASLLILVQLSTSYCASYAFLPADVGEGVDSCMQMNQ